MNQAWIAAAALMATAIVGVLGLRHFPNRIRIAFDAVLFFGISLFFWQQQTFPVFPPLAATAESAALWLRAAGGAWWFLGSRILVAALNFLAQRDRHSRGTRLFSDLSAAAIYLATAAIVLNSVFALPLTGIVATSGIVAIVIGLALQNTLADVFAGIAVEIEAPFSVGDRIQIGDTLEGIVVQINWRSIRIQTDGDDVAIIPNSLIAKAEIINRSFPSHRRAASVELTCPANAFPELVLASLNEATLLCPEILRTPAPTAVLSRLRTKHNVYKISFTVASSLHLDGTKDALLRAARRQLYFANFLQPLKPGVSTIGRLLNDLVLLECLTQEQIDALASQVILRLLEPMQELFEEGGEDALLYVVASGIVELSRKKEGAADKLGTIGAGDYVGEIGMLTGVPHAASAIALTHCRIYTLSRDAIAPLLLANKDLAAAFEKSVRHGLEILHRSVAVQHSPDIGMTGQLLRRIRGMFHLGA